MLVAHQGMLRSNEYLNGKLKVGDVEFVRSEGTIIAANVTLRDAKTANYADGSRGIQHVVIARRPDVFDPISALFEYTAYSGTTGSATMLFSVEGKPGHPRRAYTPQDLIDDLRFWLAKVGVGEETLARYATHSLRKGGLVDMLEAGGYKLASMVQGRWRSKDTITDSYYVPAADMMSQILKMKTSSLEGDRLAAAPTQVEGDTGHAYPALPVASSDPDLRSFPPPRVAEVAAPPSFPFVLRRVSSRPDSLRPSTLVWWARASCWGRCSRPSASARLEPAAAMRCPTVTGRSLRDPLHLFSTSAISFRLATLVLALASPAS